MFKFLHAADIHLDSPLQRLEPYDGAPVQALRQATRRAFENLIQLALDEQVDFVLIAGDLYDGDWKDYNTGLFLASRISRLQPAGIPVFIVTGNHDAANAMTKTLRLPQGVHVFPTAKPATFHLHDLDVAIHGQGFARRAVTQDLSAGYPAAVPGAYNIGMLHTCATGREGHEPYAPCTLPALLNKGYDYWALGHVHQREILSEDPWIVFPGNPQGRHIREIGPKGCILVQVDDGGRTQTRFQALDTVRWQRCPIDAAGLLNVDDAVDQVMPGLQALRQSSDGLPLVVRVEISGGSAVHDALCADFERLTGEIRAAAMETGGDQIWIEKVVVNTRAQPAAGLEAAAQGATAEILRTLDDIQADALRLQNLKAAVGDLLQKLPAELKEGPDAVAPEDPLWLSEMLGQARAILLRRLMPRGEGP